MFLKYFYDVEYLYSVKGFFFFLVSLDKQINVYYIQELFLHLSKDKGCVHCQSVPSEALLILMYITDMSIKALFIFCNLRFSLELRL